MKLALLSGRRTAVWLLLMAAAMAHSDRTISACSCLEGAACESAEAMLSGDHGVVFVGIVTEHQRPVTRFRVERMLAGAPAAEITLGVLPGTVFTGDRSVVSTCDMAFTAGERYLVYAYREARTGILRTSLCSRTRRMSDAETAADLSYFEARQAGRPTGGLLMGVVEERHYDSTRRPDGSVREWISVPLSGIRVTATSPSGESVSARSDERGIYMFSGLTPAPWRLKADLPAPFVPHDGAVGHRDASNDTAVRWFKDAVCAEAHIDVRVDGSIAGRILDERGRPGRGFSLELANAGAPSDQDETVIADDQGRFEFRPLPAGRYVVGVDLGSGTEPGMLDRRRYYPGVRQFAAATIVELRRGERARLETFRLPPLPAERTITLRLSAPTPDLRSATRVYLIGATRQPLELSSGTLSLHLPFGAAYWLTVEAPEGYEYDYARVTGGHREARSFTIGRDDTDSIFQIDVRPK